MKSLLLFIALLIISIISEGSDELNSEENEHFRDFEGYKVLRVTVDTEEQVSALFDLQEKNQTYDFWVDPRIGFVDIMVNYRSLQQLKSFLTTRKMTYIVMIDNVGELVQAEKEVNREYRNLTRGEITWSAYNRYDSVSLWMDELPKKYSWTKTIVIGKSTEGRPIKVLKMSKSGGNAKKAVWMDGTFHAREHITTAFVTYAMKELTENSGKYDKLHQEFDFYFLPITNPDGYEHSHTDDRMWRKTRSSQKDNCVGVDPNRNFGYRWGEVGSSDDACSEIFRGTKAFSEPETIAIRNFILESKGQVNWRAYFTIHSYSQLILTPWGFTSDLPADYNDMKRVGDIGAKAIAKRYGTKYTVGSSTNVLYAAAGGSDDWAKGTAGIKYSYTLELRDEGRYGFILPPRYIQPTCEETMDGIEAMLYATLQ